MAVSAGATPAQDSAMELPHRQPPRAARKAAPELTLPGMALARFGRLMQVEGWPFDLQRLCIDTACACDCLATAHTSDDERLRRAAIQRFEAFGRNTPTLHLSRNGLRPLAALRQVQNPATAASADKGHA